MPPKGKQPASSSGGKKKKQKQPTQRPPMQRVMVLGANGKVRFEWRPW